MEKYPIDADTPVKPQRWLKSGSLLYFYSGAMTAAVIILAVLGTLYLQDVTSRCQDMMDASEQQQNYPASDPISPMEDQPVKEREPASPTKPSYMPSANSKEKHISFTHKGKSIQEDIIKDSENGLDILVTLEGNDTSPTITVVDKIKNMMGVYSPRQDACYLVGGVEHVFKDENTTDARNDEEISYNSVDGASVDPSMMPGPLQEVCQGKPTFWLQRVPTNDMARQRRRSIIIIVVETRCCIVVFVIRSN